MSRQPLSEQGVQRRERMLDELRPIVRRRPRVARVRAGVAASVLGAVALGVVWQIGQLQGQLQGQHPAGGNLRGEDGPRQIADATPSVSPETPDAPATEPETMSIETRTAETMPSTPDQTGRSRIIIVRSDPSVLGRVKIPAREPTLARIIGDDDLARELGPRGIGVVRTADGVFLTGDPTERPGRSRLDTESTAETIE